MTRHVLRAGPVKSWAPLPIAALRGALAAPVVSLFWYVVLHLAWTAGGY